MGASAALLHGASPALAYSTGPNDRQIKNALIERLLNRRLESDTTGGYKLVSSDEPDPEKRQIWYETATGPVPERRTWLENFIANGKEEMRTAIPAATGKSYLHAAAPDDKVAFGGVLSSIKEGAQESGKRDLFLETYDRMHELLNDIVEHERHHLIEQCIFAADWFYEHGFRQGWATCNATPPSDATVTAALTAYKALPKLMPDPDKTPPSAIGPPLGWPPQAAGHHTY
jgi:hypothetical protein